MRIRIRNPDHIDEDPDTNFQFDAEDAEFLALRQVIVRYSCIEIYFFTAEEIVKEMRKCAETLSDNKIHE